MYVVAVEMDEPPGTFVISVKLELRIVGVCGEGEVEASAVSMAIGFKMGVI